MSIWDEEMKVAAKWTIVSAEACGNLTHIVARKDGNEAWLRLNLNGTLPHEAAAFMDRRADHALRMRPLCTEDQPLWKHDDVHQRLVELRDGKHDAVIVPLRWAEWNDTPETKAAPSVIRGLDATMTFNGHTYAVSQFSVTFTPDNSRAAIAFRMQSDHESAAEARRIAARLHEDTDAVVVPRDWTVDFNTARITDADGMIWHDGTEAGPGIAHVRGIPQRAETVVGLDDQTGDDVGRWVGGWAR